MFDADAPASVSAVVPSEPRQPDTLPSSLTKRKRLPLNAPAAVAPLKTCPVGLPAPGIATVRLTLVVAWVAGLTRYSVDVPAPLDETQNGLVGANEMPQALTSPGSVICAGWTVASSVTSGITLKFWAAAGQARPIAIKAAAAERRGERMGCLLEMAGYRFTPFERPRFPNMAP